MRKYVGYYERRILTGGDAMGDVMILTAIAEELKANSDTCEPLSKRIVQLAEDFDLDGDQVRIGVEQLGCHGVP